MGKKEQHKTQWAREKFKELIESESEMNMTTHTQIQKETYNINKWRKRECTQQANIKKRLVQLTQFISAGVMIEKEEEKNFEIGLIIITSFTLNFPGKQNM